MACSDSDANMAFDNVLSSTCEDNTLRPSCSMDQEVNSPEMGLPRPWWPPPPAPVATTDRPARFLYGNPCRTPFSAFVEPPNPWTESFVSRIPWLYAPQRFGEMSRQMTSNMDLREPNLEPHQQHRWNRFDELRAERENPDMYDMLGSRHLSVDENLPLLSEYQYGEETPEVNWNVVAALKAAGAHAAPEVRAAQARAAGLRYSDSPGEIVRRRISQLRKQFHDLKKAAASSPERPATPPNNQVQVQQSANIHYDDDTDEEIPDCVAGAHRITSTQIEGIGSECVQETIIESSKLKDGGLASTSKRILIQRDSCGRVSNEIKERKEFCPCDILGDETPPELFLSPSNSFDAPCFADDAFNEIKDFNMNVCSPRRSPV